MLKHVRVTAVRVLRLKHVVTRRGAHGLRPPRRFFQRRLTQGRRQDGGQHPGAGGLRRGVQHRQHRGALGLKNAQNVGDGDVRHVGGGFVFAGEFVKQDPHGAGGHRCSPVRRRVPRHHKRRRQQQLQRVFGAQRARDVWRKRQHRVGVQAARPLRVVGGVGIPRKTLQRAADGSQERHGVGRHTAAAGQRSLKRRHPRDGGRDKQQQVHERRVVRADAQRLYAPCQTQQWRHHRVGVVVQLVQEQAGGGAQPPPAFVGRQRHRPRRAGPPHLRHAALVLLKRQRFKHARQQQRPQRLAKQRRQRPFLREKLQHQGNAQVRRRQQGAQRRGVFFGQHAVKRVGRAGHDAGFGEVPRVWVGNQPGRHGGVLRL